MKKKSGGFLLGAIIGGTAAAVTALLLAPKAGRELRDELADQFGDFKEKAYDYGDYVQEKSTEFGGQAAEFAGSMKEKAVKSSEDALASLKQQTDDLSDRFKQTAAEEELVQSEVVAAFEDESQDIILNVDEVAEEAIQTTEEMVDAIEAEAKAEIEMPAETDVEEDTKE